MTSKLSDDQGPKFEKARAAFLLGLERLKDQDYEAAEIAFQESLSIIPDRIATLINLGAVQIRQEKFEEAYQTLSKVLSTAKTNLDISETHLNLGLLYHVQKDYGKAVINYEKSLSSNQKNYGAYLNLGLLNRDIGNYDLAIDRLNSAIETNSSIPDAYSAIADVYALLKRHDKAAIFFGQAARLQEHTFNYGKAFHQRMLCCDWSDFDQQRETIEDRLIRGEQVIDPFGYAAIAESEELAQKCARIFAKGLFPSQTQEKTTKEAKNNYCHSSRRLKVGYVCGEFRNHATTHLMMGVWEHHDREHFDIYAFDNGYSDKSEWRDRILKAFGSNNLFLISNLTDKRVVELIKSVGIDILVNLNGYYGRARQKIFAMRATPIQVNYLGFPGTLGSDYMDYLIADRVVIPEKSKIFYDEKVVYLPGCYQANDYGVFLEKAPGPAKSNGLALGLPRDKFIFCCFNNNYKITPKMFGVWVSILSRVDNSVLWLLADNPEAKKNLQMQFKAWGLDPSRLIFADRVDRRSHIERQWYADLFLDTFPYAAHTTASDALRAGLPLLTLTGNVFPSRVADSLLRELGLEELVASSYHDYENIAVSLATSPNLIGELRRKLRAGLLQDCALFDPKVFTRRIEKLYQAMASGH